MFRLLVPGIACTLLIACASPAPVTPAAGPAEPVVAKTDMKPPERPFPQDSIYPLLLAEFALRRRAYDVALEQYLAQAPLLRDAGVSAHATHLAQFMAREKEALEAVQLWVALEPDSIEANNTLSILLIRQGRTLEALPHMATLARAGEQPNFATLLTDFDQLDPARQSELARGIDQLALEFPDNVQLLLTQAMLLAELDQFDRAQEKLQKIFQLEPSQRNAALVEAKILLTRDAPRPYARVERLLEENPEDKQFRLQYARLLTATDMEAARAQFEILSAQSPRDGDLLLSLALVNLEVGDRLQAKAHLRQLLALEQHVDEAHYQLGRIAEEDGDPEGALYEYRQVEDGREFFAAASRAGTLLLAAGQVEETGAWFNRLRESHPQRREQLYGIEADLLSRAGETTAAAGLLDSALAAMPDSMSLRYARAMLAEQEGDLALMEEELRRILAAEPDNATALNALGYTLANRTKRFDEAYALIARALALDPNEPAILDSMGWVLYRLQRNEEALDYLARAYAVFPDPEVAAHLGEVLWVTGDTEGATAVFQGALLKDPGNAVLVETLGRLGVTGIETVPLTKVP